MQIGLFRDYLNFIGFYPDLRIRIICNCYHCISDRGECGCPRGFSIGRASITRALVHADLSGYGVCSVTAAEVNGGRALARDGTKCRARHNPGRFAALFRTVVSNGGIDHIGMHRCTGRSSSNRARLFTRQ